MNKKWKRGIASISAFLIGLSSMPAILMETAAAELEEVGNKIMSLAQEAEDVIVTVDGTSDDVETDAKTEYGNFDYTNADNYVADCLQKGIISPETGEASASGPVVYKAALSHDYTYERLAEALLEDEALVDLSSVWTLWDSACSGDFSNLSETQLYEALIMDYLAYETQSSKYKSDFETKSAKYAWEIYDEMLEEVIDNAEYLTTAEVLANTDLEVVKQACKDAGLAEKIKKYTDLVSDLNDVGTNAYDYYKKLTQALALQEVNESRVEYLRAIKEAASGNTYMCDAIDNIIEKMEASYAEISFDQGVETMLNYGVSKTWEGITDVVPGFGGIKLGVNGLDMLFNSSDTAVNNTKLLLLYTLDQYAKQALMKKTRIMLLILHRKMQRFSMIPLKVIWHIRNMQLTGQERLLLT